MKLFSSLLFLVTFSIAEAQYTTPGTGVDWTLDDIATASPETVTVSGSTYTLLEDLVVASNDILRIDTNLTMQIEAGVRITVLNLGSFFVEADAVIITAVNETAPFDGFRFEEGAMVDIQNTTIQFGGGLQVLTESFVLNNCVLLNNVSGVATGGTIALSRGTPIISNNEFKFNNNPAISSAANQSVSAIITGNLFEANNQSNSNRPQINLGATRLKDTLKIINNTIIGGTSLDQAGGIAVANLVGGALRVIIEGNTITNNRYGLTIVGSNSYALIKNNIIENNNTQGNPNLGGSGINLNAPTGGMIADVTANQINNNLWGVTLQGPVDANFGDDKNNPGLNVFSENGNNDEIFALYNNGPSTISAKNNCWVEGGEGTLAEAEGVIFHQVDDPTLGEVIFDPVFCDVLEVADTILASIQVYPTFVKDNLQLKWNWFSGVKITIYDLYGNVLQSQSSFENTATINVTAYKHGLYFVEFESETGQRVSKKFIKI